MFLFLEMHLLYDKLRIASPIKLLPLLISRNAFVNILHDNLRVASPIKLRVASPTCF